MSHFLVITLALIIAILVGSAISVPLYGWLEPEPLIKFHRFTKFLIILLIIAFTLFILKMHNLSLLKICGFAREAKPMRSFLTSLFAGILIALPLVVIFYLIGLRTLDDTPGEWYTIFRILIAALLVAVIEESFFRGVLMDGFIKAGQTIMAVLLPSALFTLVHFMAIQESPPQATAAWYSGIWKLFDGIQEKHMLYDAMQTAAALFMASVFLSLIRLSGGHIIPCIGIHCGWIVAIKVNKEFTSRNPDSSFMFLISNYDGFIGWAAAIWFGLLVIWWITNLRHTATHHQ